MAINKELYTQQIDATMTILQMCTVINEYIKLLIDTKEEKDDVTDKLKVIQDQIDIIKTNVQNNTSDITTNTNAIKQLNTQVTALNTLLANYKELNIVNLQDLIKGSDDITVDLDPTQEHLIIKLDQDVKDNINNLDNNVTTLLNDFTDNTNDINKLKSPVLPISLNTEDKLSLNIGEGLKVDSTGKLSVNILTKKYCNMFSFSTPIYGENFIFNFNIISENKITTYQEIIDFYKTKNINAIFIPGNSYIGIKDNKSYFCVELKYDNNFEKLFAYMELVTNNENELEINRIIIDNSQITYNNSYIV